MALVNRQNNLFAAEDWKVAYKAFSQVDFQAYDFDTIKNALVDYIKTNFPENFNDYTESSEFIAIIEMLAFISQSLAFRMDLNSRENFLETAERRDSVFKLARMLGYNPRRNICASGLLKVDSIRTSETVTDSAGNNLNNVNIFFDDANNPDSYEQFLLVLNSAMSSSNRYSAPVKSGKVADVPTDIYEIQTQLNAPISFPFKISVNNRQLNFEVVNPDFKDAGVFEEQHPNPLNNFNLIYRNDGKGIGSDDTGFFLMFKQGTLGTSDFNYITPIENRIENVNIPNINESDVWLSELDSNGVTLNKWQRVPNTVGQTLTYNDLTLGEKNLYSIENIDNAGIRLKFPDGTFGNIPYGRFKMYHRVSLPEAFTITPAMARNIQIPIPYENATGEKHTLTITCSLKYTVKNSLPAETLGAIKQRAPQAFYTQNRMVSAQDYNVFPFSQSSNITKLKAINRTHAGHSRYIDINDPTGTYQNLETFAQDGALYSESKTVTSQFTEGINNTVSEVLTVTLPKILKNQRLSNFVYNQYREGWMDLDTNKFNIERHDILFKSLPVVTGKSQTGYFTEKSSVAGQENVLINNYFNNTTGKYLFKMFQENNFLRFENPKDPSQWTWARITRIDNNGELSSGLSTGVAPIQISDKIQHNWKVTDYIPSIRKEFATDRNERSLIGTELENKRTFALGYDSEKDFWYVIQNTNINKTGEWSPFYSRNTSGNGLDASWLVLCEFAGTVNGRTTYNVTSRGQHYIVESKKDLKFYNIQNSKILDSDNAANQDLITFTKLNFKPGSSETFTWVDSNSDGLGDSFKGDVFRSDLSGDLYQPNGYLTNIPLRARNTKWYDVTVDWKTNLGIFRNGDRPSNVFVNPAIVNLPTYFKTDDSGANASYSNITLSNNSGIINFWPGQVTFEFNNTTFGYNVLAANGEIIYRDYNSDTQQLEIYHANATTGTYSYGPNNDTANANATGRVLLLDSNPTLQTGNIRIKNWNENAHTYVRDAGGLSRDQMVVNYAYDKDKLDNDIKWTVVEPVKYNDGFTDNRKVIVSAYDVDGDLVPDRPLQFREFVNKKDLVFFDHYTDFDGYKYSRPFTGAIEDLRNETSISVNISQKEISPGSYTNTKSLDKIDLVILKKQTLVSQFENSVGALNGLLLYAVDTKKIFQLTKQSTNPNIVSAIEKDEDEFYVRNGRSAGQNTASQSNDEVIFKWKHVAPKDVRIDPSISNVVEMLVLTSTYYSDVLKYKKVPGTEWPYPPTSSELANEFKGLQEFKSASDTLVFKSAKFKKLFGDDADEGVQAKFRVVKLKSSTLSDNEIRSRIIKAFDTYFNVDNWEFGETFYFTELSSYVHQRLGSNIGSIVIIPRNTSGKFGDLFQVKGEPDELFLNTATVNDIEVVEKISQQTLSVKR